MPHPASLLATRFQQVLPAHVLVVLALLVLVALVLALVRHEKRLATALVERDQEVGGKRGRSWRPAAPAASPSSLRIAIECMAGSRVS